MNEQDLVGKTIAKSEWVVCYDASRAEDGYGNLRLTFTDGSSVTVCYSCMGGVFLDVVEGDDETV